MKIKSLVCLLISFFVALIVGYYGSLMQKICGIAAFTLFCAIYVIVCTVER